MGVFVWRQAGIELVYNISMGKIFIYIGILGVIVIIFELVFQKSKPEVYPFEKKERLLTTSEMIFFRVILQIINDRYFIFPQIHLASILQIKKGEFDRKNWKRYFNKLIQKSFDFVIFKRDTLEPLLVIELDDSTHSQFQRVKRDLFVDQALRAAQIPILHIKPQQDYNIEELKTLIFSKLGSEGKICR